MDTRKLLQLAAVVALALGGSAAAQERQPLTLREAVARALAGNPLHHAAAAGADAAQAGTREARARLFPQITFSETATRGNDPVYVFGTKLRQQRFTAADFALDSLNRPTPIGNFSARFQGDWRLFDSLETWRGVQRAEAMRDAARHQLTRADQELVLRVVEAYYGVLHAARQLAVASQAETTAAAMLERVRDRHARGLVVEADRLSAEVHRAQRQQEHIRARNELLFARAALNLALAESPDAPLEPADVLAEPQLAAPELAQAEARALAERPDLKRAGAESAAQQKSVAMAKSAFGPRVNFFAGWETDTRSLFGGGGNNWTGGLQLELDLFQGGGKLARLARERALARQAEALRQAHADRVRLEVRRAFYDFDSARQQLEVARAGSAQAAESYRIQQNRYEAGLAPLTDLLRVEEEMRRTQADYWDAVYRLRLSHAALEFATGTLAPESPGVTQ